MLSQANLLVRIEQPSHERLKPLFLAVMKRQVIVIPYFDKRPVVRRQEAHCIAGTIVPEQQHMLQRFILVLII